MGLVTAPVASGVNEDEPVALLQRLDVAIGVPVTDTAGEPVLEHQRRPVALDVVVDVDSVVIYVWHRSLRWSGHRDGCECSGVLVVGQEWLLRIP